MRRPAAVFLTFALAAGVGGCGDDTPAPAVTPPPPRERVTAAPVTLACGSSRLKIPAPPPPLARSGTFGRLGSLARRLTVKGVTWHDDDGEQLRAGVVCGVRTAEQFATLVARSTLTAYRGKPALRWTTRGGLRNFMWLESPGTAVYLAATPGLTAQLRQTAAAIRQGAS
ncbi:hypothetical protein ACFFV7_33380 [Nonomuraea spiralis]|uniref:DUF3558 domain-containing protein n=1 Tax=Nonomuraea spiralis TaxID=46182 RepID=A0ABV5INN7_9ACTN|nr:hypothetical protein [Nonomuraea spiralis]GGT32713.1 hypothetical protein GCM10010176_091550 [Nonomuraea spiralis]